MSVPELKSVAGLFLAAMLALPAYGSNTDSNAKAAVPGTLNYVEGQVSMGNQALDSKSIGVAEMEAGESLTTGNGKAEVLLTPGVFLRVGVNSSVKMVTPNLTNTEVELNKGHAMVEVAEIHKQNDIRVVMEDGDTARLLKTGLYDFDQRKNELRVFDGKAKVEGSQTITVKSGRELALAANGPLKAQKFDKKTYEEGDLFRWSSLRSAYLAEANVDAADRYATNMWGPWGGASWYWDPWYDAYTFIPGDGIFYSPFGWGFYSPWFVGQAPFYGYGFGFGNRPPLPRRFSSDFRSWAPHSPYVASPRYSHGVYRGPGSTGTGFHSGPVMASGAYGSGFHDSAFRGGGFHGGGFHGGGFHGGGGGHR